MQGRPTRITAAGTGRRRAWRSRSAAPTRRRLQVALAGLWLLDAVLECQPSFFQPEFFGGMLMMNMTAPPAWLWNLLTAVEPVVVTHAAPANAAAVAVQFAIGLGLLWRTTVRAALALSVPWALTVWLFGEMGGGLFVGGGSALTGAPGAALLYAIVAVLLWPRRPDAGTVVADGGLLPRPAPLLVWAAVWVGTAALEGGYLDRSPTFAAQAMDNAAVAGPGWLHAAGQAVGGLVGTHGALFAAVAGTAQAAVGVGVLFPGARRAALAAGAALALFYGAVGQAFGGLFSNGVLGILGSGATDPGAAPITVVLALTLWPRVPRPAPRRDSSPPGSWAHRFRARAAPTPSPSGG